MASNNREPAIRFNDLYNALALFAMDYENLMKLDGPGFDVEFELESEYVIGFDIRNLDYLVDNKIITAYVKDELLEFQSFIESIPGEFWFVSEFETNPVWNDVRRRADEMLNLLGISYRDYDSSYITIIDA